MDAKAVLNLGKLGIRLVANASTSRASLDALGQLAKVDAKNVAKVENNFLRDDWQQFDIYRSNAANRPGGSWDWQKQAPNDGAIPGSAKASSAEVGSTLDRYGSRKGEYMSPAGTPFDQRSLPPGKASEPYEQYMVQRKFEMVSEEIAPAFGQPGHGTQLRARIPEVGDARFATIEDLLIHGYIKVKP